MASALSEGMAMRQGWCERSTLPSASRIFLRTIRNIRHCGTSSGRSEPGFADRTNRGIRRPHVATASGKLTMSHPASAAGVHLATALVVESRRAWR